LPVRSVPVRCPPASAVRYPIRVASVPEHHIYVWHLAPCEGDSDVLRLPDPPSPPGRPAAAPWWPPGALNRRWIERHADEFDVFHVHFGFDALTADELADVVDALSACGKPLVYTVHDLRNPHHESRAAHDAQLDVLVPRADALITLTAGAAAEIRRRWGRYARVLPHPHVVDFDRMARPHPGPRAEYVVGVHAKSVRASMAPGPVIAAVLPLLGKLPGLRLQINVHREVVAVDGMRHDPALTRVLADAAQTPRVDLRVHEFFSDAQLWDYLQALDVSLLPYRFGTHSGWLEACLDLGTTVLAPTCGYYADQGPCLSYRHDEDGLDVASLQAAVEQAYRTRPAARATVAERRAQRDGIAAAHRDIYAELLR